MEVSLKRKFLYLFIFMLISIYNTHQYTVEESFSTLPILGGGDSVAFDPIYDNAEYTFLCRKDLNALKYKYLKIEVFDKETGTADRLIGTAHIMLKKINQKLDQTQFATVSLYGGVETNYQWSGTVEIAATFKKIDLDEVQEITLQINEKIERDVKKKLGLLNKLSNKINDNSDKEIKKQRIRSATDQIMLNRMQSKGIDHNETIKKIEEEYEREQREKREREESKTRIIQGVILNLVLFLSLILSGTLFFGAMNEYEVMKQKEFMKSTYNTKFSVIDSFRWSIVTVTTIGYGDFYPQTAGGRLFGTFFIIFGVSLLARLLNTVLDRAAANYEEARLKRITNRKAVTHDSIQEFDEDNDGVITNYEFLKTMLIRRGDTTKDIIDEIMSLFDKYDQDKSGEIEIEEIKNLIKRKQQNEEEQEQGKQESEFAEKERNNKKTANNAVRKLNVMKSADNLQLDLFPDQDIKEDEFEDDDEFEYALTIEVRACDNLKEADDLIAAEDSFWSFIIGWFGFILYLCFGAMIFTFVEDGYFGDMLWMFVVTTCTVGYGDVYPKTRAGKILNVFFISISVVLFVSTFSSTFDYIYARQEALIKQKAMKKKSMQDMINKFPLLADKIKMTEKDQVDDKRKKNENDKQEVTYIPNKMNESNNKYVD